MASWLAWVGASVACGRTDLDSGDLEFRDTGVGAGGYQETGGGKHTGGWAATGGTSPRLLGGSPATGGRSVTGGMSSRPTGGRAPTGGSSFTGGKTGTGGSLTGGKTATGGTYTGGKTATGGTYTGGKTATGGTYSGGTTAIGGTYTGGTYTGGKTATGGTYTGGTGTGGLLTGGLSGFGGTSTTGGAGTGGFGGTAGTGGTSAVQPVALSCQQICQVTSGSSGLTCYGYTSTMAECWYYCVAYANPAMGAGPELISEYNAAMACTAQNLTSLSDYTCSAYSVLGVWTYANKPTACDAAMCKWTCDDINYGMYFADYGFCRSAGGRCSCC